MLAAGLAVHKEQTVWPPQRRRGSATPSGMGHSTSSWSRRAGSKRGMASAGGVLGRCCGSGLGSAGAPSSQGLWGRPRSTGASGCRRRMRGPRCWGRARASVPAPWRARVGDDQETTLGHAAGRAGMPCPRWGL